MHKGTEICNNFNSFKGCFHVDCMFLHICKKCKKTGHGENSCETLSKHVPSEVSNSSKKIKNTFETCGNNERGKHRVCDPERTGKF